MSPSRTQHDIVRVLPDLAWRVENAAALDESEHLLPMKNRVIEESAEPG